MNGWPILARNAVAGGQRGRKAPDVVPQIPGYSAEDGCVPVLHTAAPGPVWRYG